jgi:hypothetical protein
MMCKRPGCVCEGDVGGFELDAVGAVGGVEDVSSLWSNLISS